MGSPIDCASIKSLGLADHSTTLLSKNLNCYYCSTVLCITQVWTSSSKIHWGGKNSVAPRSDGRCLSLSHSHKLLC